MGMQKLPQSAKEEGGGRSVVLSNSVGDVVVARQPDNNWYESWDEVLTNKILVNLIRYLDWLTDWRRKVYDQPRLNVQSCLVMIFKLPEQVLNLDECTHGVRHSKKLRCAAASCDEFQFPRTPVNRVSDTAIATHDD